ncbi:MAG: relaxase/mobilization nuclease domain-containing protein [Ruminococcus sp.]|nr:relaxase/mobilization nuclease domain-containing protein [Ruminococcus sp.]MCM1381780.1 relaxase/mobilization nuclease domain-containing protein [Muribaculaceae bacterium]MCM1480183.1 relaxase/mobilization nuclease domain-containing protein [Muribaculaceae bacterium]MCM1525456.1 relaxase/mobilization nuclease domain-containing protein [Ruminococcus sp.]
MAVTKIHPIKNSLNRAVDYITNPHKTEEQEYVAGYECSHVFAAYEFLREQQEKGYRGHTQGFHLIQSFEPNEVTPKQAHEIGKRLADELLKGQYKYVISTHTDKGHIHNHIIINSVNSVTGKSFSLEHDKKFKPAWKRIREISDELCAENDLSVIKKPEIGKGKGHYEWEQDKAGNSWKSKLKAAIDECIKSADSFEDFLQKMRESGYEIKHGKHIAFRAEGQERFTRAKTLGFYYTEENIRFRIDRRLMYREQSPKENVGRFVEINEKVQASEGLRRWAVLQNMQSASKLLNKLTEKGIDSKEELTEKILGLHDDRLDVIDEIKSIEKEMTELSENIRSINNYLTLKPINEQYRKAKDRDGFFRKHESELRLFDSAKRAVKPLWNDNKKLPNRQSLQNRVDKLNEKKSALMKRYGEIKSDIAELEQLKSGVERFERSDRARDVARGEDR